METSHENSRFRSQLIEKTLVLSINKLTKAKCKLSVISFTSLLASCQPSYASLLKIQEVDYFLNQLKIQPIDTQPLITIQNGNCQESSQLEKINQLSFFDSFNCIDKVAVTGNNLKQELQNLLNTVQYHHTLVDVFLCLSFANCLFAGELRLALALVRLWWGGSGNKPLGANTTCRLCFAVLNLPTALSLGQSSKSLPIRKV